MKLKPEQKRMLESSLTVLEFALAGHEVGHALVDTYLGFPLVRGPRIYKKAEREVRQFMRTGRETYLRHRPYGRVVSREQVTEKGRSQLQVENLVTSFMAGLAAQKVLLKEYLKMPNEFSFLWRKSKDAERDFANTDILLASEPAASKRNLIRRARRRAECILKEHLDILVPLTYRLMSDDYLPVGIVRNTYLQQRRKV